MLFAPTHIIANSERSAMIASMNRPCIDDACSYKHIIVSFEFGKVDGLTWRPVEPVNSTLVITSMTSMLTIQRPSALYHPSSQASIFLKAMWQIWFLISYSSCEAPTLTCDANFLFTHNSHRLLSSTSKTLNHAQDVFAWTSDSRLKKKASNTTFHGRLLSLVSSVSLFNKLWGHYGDFHRVR